jgi:cytochrome P450
LQFLVYNLARCTYRVWFHPLSRFPGPTLLSAVYFPFLYEHFINGTWIRKVAKLHRQYGPIIRIGPDHLAIDGAIGWPEVFSPRSAQLNEYPKLAKLFQGDTISLLCAPRDIHRRQRHQIRHAFSDTAIIQQEATVRKYVDMLLNQLEERANQQQIINIVEWLHFAAFDIVGDLTISESFQSLQNSSYHPWVQSFFQAIRAISIRRFLRSYSILNMLGTLISHASMTKTDEVLSYMATKVKARITLQYGRDDTTPDYVAYMLAKTNNGESGMSEGEILATSPFLVIAGSETIATALSGFWFYLARDQLVYDAITAEIRSAFSTEAEITMQSTVQLNYLVACIKEILRIYPPIPSMPQRVSPGGSIDGKYVPAGVCPPMVTLHYEHRLISYRPVSLCTNGLHSAIRNILRNLCRLFRKDGSL